MGDTMPVPTLITDLDTVANNNSPPGTESAKGNIDNYIRTLSAFIKQAYNAAQDNSLTWAGTAGGTANALTLTLSPAITAIAAGQRFAFKSGASPNSAATTVAISGLTAIAVQVNGVACAGGEIAANKWYEILADTTTTCQLKKIGRATLTELGISAFAQTILDDADASTVLTTLGVSTFIKTLLDDVDAAAARTTLGVGSASTSAAGIVQLATGAEAITGTDALKALTPATLRSAITAPGTAPMYAARAWVNFNGTGTVAINASGNVSSITDNGVGDYTSNFTTAMPDANYGVSGTTDFFGGFGRGISIHTVSAASLRFIVWDGTSTRIDQAIVTVIITR